MSLRELRGKKKKSSDNMSDIKKNRKKPFLTPYEMAIFSVLGTLMYCSKVIMEQLPNIHLLGMFTMTFALVYGVKGLVPLYVYDFLNGLLTGFGVWWVPYLYIWTILWGVTMILPKKLPTAISAIMYSVVCGLHGLLFGVMYAPAQALFFGLDFNQTLAWIAAGLPFDILHAIGNFAAGFLIIPLVKLIKKIETNIEGKRPKK